MVAHHGDIVDLTAGDGDADGHFTLLAVHGGLVGAVLHAGHVKGGGGHLGLGKQGLIQHIGGGLHGLTLGKLHAHHVPAGDAAKDDGTHDAGTAGDILAPDTANHLTGGEQAGDGSAAFIQDPGVGVGGDAAQGHDHQSLDGAGIVLLALDLVDGHIVGIQLLTAEVPAELVGAPGLHGGVIVLHGLLQGLGGDIDLPGQLLNGIGLHNELVAHAGLRLIVGGVHIGGVGGLQVLHDLVGVDVVLHGAGLLFQSGLTGDHLVQRLVDKTLAVLVDVDTAGLPGIDIADQALAGSIFQTHGECGDIAHLLLVHLGAHHLHDADALAVGAVGAAHQIVLAVLGKLAHHSGVAGVAAGGHDDALVGVIANGVPRLTVDADGGEDLPLLVAHQSLYLGVEVDGDIIIGGNDLVQDLVGGGLVILPVHGTGLIGPLNGIKLMLWGEHALLAPLLGEGILTQAVVPQPLDGGHILLHIGLDHLPVALLVAVGENVLDVGRLGVLDAVQLLDDGLGAGHGAAGVVQGAAGLPQLLHNDDALSAGVCGGDGGGQTGAAGAHHDHVGRLLLVIDKGFGGGSGVGLLGAAAHQAQGHGPGQEQCECSLFHYSTSLKRCCLFHSCEILDEIHRMIVSHSAGKGNMVRKRKCSPQTPSKKRTPGEEARGCKTRKKDEITCEFLLMNHCTSS